MAELGYKHYMFIDGDLPGNGDDMSLPGHEAMMITNKSDHREHLFRGQSARQGSASDDPR